jgi:hypothetical protein
MNDLSTDENLANYLARQKEKTTFHTIDETVENLQKEISPEALASYIKQAKIQKSELEIHVKKLEVEKARATALTDLFPLLKDLRFITKSDNVRLSLRADTTVSQTERTIEKIDRVFPENRYDQRLEEIEGDIALIDHKIEKEQKAISYQEKLIKLFESLEKTYKLAA